MLQPTISFLLDLLQPGAGVAYRGRPGLGLLFQAIFYLMLSVLVVTRLLLQPLGWYLLAAAILLLVIASAVIGLWLPICAIPIKRRLLTLLTFAALSTGALALTLLNKQTLLGIQVYFVPSASMTPTLLPGDFIVLDTWAYTAAKPPQVGDIVVFQQSEDFAVVKRCAQWPDNGSTVQNEQIYVLGDNPALSMDSRKLGGIDLAKVKGKVHLRLLGWSADDERWHWHVAGVN